LLIALLWIDTVLWASLLLVVFIQFASMLADLAEEVAVKTGRRSEGVLYSADNIIRQALTGVGVSLAGLMLAWVAFPMDKLPGLVDQGLIDNLALLYLAAGILLGAPGIGVLYLYSHDRDQHEANLKILREAHVRHLAQTKSNEPE
jgi:Na+/melibiose symporter-like transporter